MIDDILDDPNRANAFDAGLITGIAVGAAVALLCAPMRGDAFRRQLDSTLRRVRQIARQYVDLEGNVRRDVEQVRRAIDQVWTDFRNTAHDLLGPPADADAIAARHPL